MFCNFLNVLTKNRNKCRKWLSNFFLTHFNPRLIPFFRYLVQSYLPSIIKILKFASCLFKLILSRIKSLKSIFSSICCHTGNILYFNSFYLSIFLDSPENWLLINFLKKVQHVQKFKINFEAHSESKNIFQTILRLIWGLKIL